MAGTRQAGFAAVLALLGPAAAAGDPCALESLPAARTACLGAEADRLMAGMELRLASFGADAYTVGAGALAAFSRALARAQAEWRAGMETACRTAPDPAACRLGAAEKRAARIDEVLAGALARHGLAPPPVSPDCAVLLDLDHPRDHPGASRRPRIECDLTGLAAPR